jgi:hypothetical protein
VIDASGAASPTVEVSRTTTVSVRVEPADVLADSPRLLSGVLVPERRLRPARPHSRYTAPRYLSRRRGLLQRKAPRARPTKRSGQSAGSREGSDPGGEGDSGPSNQRPRPSERAMRWNKAGQP